MPAKLRALRFREELAYWKGQLDGVSPLELPTGRSRPNETSLRIAAQSFDIPAHVSSRLTATAGQHDVSWLDLMVAERKGSGRAELSQPVLLGAALTPVIMDALGVPNLRIASTTQAASTLKDLSQRVSEVVGRFRV